MAEASPSPQAAARILTSVTRRSRVTAAIALLGIVVVIASLATLYLIASNRAELAEQREQVARENARTIADQLERIRSAYARGDISRVGIELGVAVTKAEDLTENPDEAIAAGPADITRTRALEIATERPRFDVAQSAAAFDQAVYIQFAGDLTRAQITALNQALRKAGWAAQGASGERIPTAEGLNEVRYSGENEAAARTLAQAINDAGITSAPVRARKVDIIKPGVLEAWISA